MNLTTQPNSSDDAGSLKGMIQTSVVKEIYEELTRLMNAAHKSGFPQIGIFEGEKGTGKTFTSANFAVDVNAGNPKHVHPVLWTQATTQSAKRELGDNICLELGCPPIEGNYNLARRLNEDCFEKERVRLFVTDESNRLTNELFEFYREMFDFSTGTSFAFFGQPGLEELIRRNIALTDRSKNSFPVKELTLDEFVTKFLPGLNFPYWHFDPNDSKQSKMGEWIYAHTTPSLRRARNGVLEASLLAQEQKREIDEEILKQGLKRAVMPKTRSQPKAKNNDPTYVQEAVQRQIQREEKAQARARRASAKSTEQENQENANTTKEPG